MLYFYAKWDLHNLQYSAPSFFNFFKNFYWSIVALQYCYFILYSRVNQLYIYTYPLIFGFPSHLGHHRALSRVPCAIK